MTNRKKQKILDKVSHLFNLAENNPSEEEASLALKKAKDLLIEYQLTEMDLEDRKQQVEGKKESAFEPGCIEVKPPQSRMHQWIKSTCIAVCSFFEVEWMYYKGNTFHKRPPVIVFYGLKTNCEIAAFAFNSVYAQINKLAKKYKPSRVDFHLQDYYSDFAIFSVQARFEYRVGLAHGLQERAYQEKKRNQTDHGEKCVVLATRAKEASSTWLKNENIQFRSAPANKGSYGTGTNAGARGRADSDKIDIHGRGLGEATAKGELR